MIFIRHETTLALPPSFSQLIDPCFHFTEVEKLLTQDLQKELELPTGSA
ncbi:MAG: hypothetical protein LPK49_11085 [Bacteroidota bacterium]|nr:hypothetical protein [Bacteroidota bacterium]MDX5431571.1 hypothetical protein [Bacteroidota bacterium]